MENKNADIQLGNDLVELNQDEVQDIQGGYSFMNGVITKIYNGLISIFNLWYNIIRALKILLFVASHKRF